MIITLDDLDNVRSEHADKKLVLTSGTFDLFHVGHLNYLEQVKQYGDIVIVLLSSDKRVKSRKNSSRPVIPEKERARILDALKIVSYVFIDPSELGPEETDPVHNVIIQRLHPDFYVTDGPDPRFVNLLGKDKFIIVDRKGGGKYGSTSTIIDHIRSE